MLPSLAPTKALASQSVPCVTSSPILPANISAVRNLALEYPKSPLRSGPFLIYLTARSPERGAEALKVLNADPQLKTAKVLAADGGETTIKFRSLDISDESSVHSFRDFLKKEHPEGIDVLVNNAGVAMDGFGQLICFLVP